MLRYLTFSTIVLFCQKQIFVTVRTDTFKLGYLKLNWKEGFQPSYMADMKVKSAELNIYTDQKLKGKLDRHCRMTKEVMSYFIL